MKILKGILFTVLGLVVLALVVAIFVKKEYTVERDIVINKPRQQVYDYIKYLKNQNNFSKWAKMDPSMKTEFRGTDGTVGFVSAWDSNQKDVGKGEQEIKGLQEGKRIDTEIRFIKPFESTCSAYMTTEDAGLNSTKVTWVFNGKMNYPMNLMLLCMSMDKMIGGDLQIGLNNLKGILE
ncbi:polyketide cyclase [Pedobacter sp. HMWF019]|uniref:SRPBCC family protein n=1 Tax=Pedobacter sp. HMWF019 TaxID=2056856 RepID=UPI000D3A5598|nr:SRPBCC family protein [Pedobacter sp. HMWF019]PTS98086.1 polyketide cyclase [Pedobacter sp. HMWF019]